MIGARPHRSSSFPCCDHQCPSPVAEKATYMFISHRLDVLLHLFFKQSYPWRSERKRLKCMLALLLD